MDYYRRLKVVEEMLDWDPFKANSNDAYLYHTIPG
jgi:hypothetical protein